MMQKREGRMTELMSLAREKCEDPRTNGRIGFRENMGISSLASVRKPIRWINVLLGYL